LATYDLVLLNGTIVDGSGLPPYQGDLALKDGKIAAVGKLPPFTAKKTVDLSGFTVAPGFIDLLCHNDLLWSFTEQQKAIHRGVTSGLAGNCGFSILDVEKNLQKLQKHKSMINLGTLVGQGTLRDFFWKTRRKEIPDAASMGRMKNLMDGALKAGAFGLSSGLGYEPGEWCQSAELEDLASVLTRYPHAAYYTHIRNYRSGVLDAIREALQLGGVDKVPVVIQHLLFKLPSNWDQTESGLRLFEEARGKGQEAWATVYPYDFWGNEVQIPLYQFLYLPEDTSRWSFYHKEDKAEDVMALIHRRLQEYGGGDKIEITKVKSNSSKSALGLTLKELAQQRKLTEENAVLALLLENGKEVKICYHGLSEEGLIKKIQSPFVLFGSDSAATIPHPRDVGAFPRLLGTYVRDQGVIRLSEAIKRLTQVPAQIMGLKDRGLLKPGYWGDVVVFDEKTIGDNATAVAPWAPPTGMRMVLVNGQQVFGKGIFLNEYPGMVLRRQDR
jgi:N-acyl-D-amino-acid deacylase